MDSLPGIPSQTLPTGVQAPNTASTPGTVSTGLTGWPTGSTFQATSSSSSSSSGKAKKPKAKAKKSKAGKAPKAKKSKAKGGGKAAAGGSAGKAGKAGKSKKKKKTKKKKNKGSGLSPPGNDNTIPTPGPPKPNQQQIASPVSSPSSVMADKDGNLLVLGDAADGGTIARMKADGTVLQKGPPTGLDLEGMTLGPDGKVPPRPRTPRRWWSSTRTPWRRRRS